MKKEGPMKLLRAILLAAGLAGAARGGLVINELHYDNVGVDVGEFIEVVTEPSQRAGVLAGLDVLYLYNGGDGRVYRQANLEDFSFHGTWADGMDYYSQAFSGIQNGSPDGLALADHGSVVEFLSYEGSFVATDGPAAGLTSIDIGARESPLTLIGSSLQRMDFGGHWVLTEGTNTRGATNSCNTIPVPQALGLAVVGLAALTCILLKCLAHGEPHRAETDKPDRAPAQVRA
jgi:hypothetical protein